MDERWTFVPQINSKIDEISEFALETRYNETEDTNTALHGFSVAGEITIKF